MKIDMTNSRLTTLTGLFDVNASLSDDVPKFIESLPHDEREQVRLEYKRRLKENIFRAEQFRRSTACDARDEKSARKFFEDVYKYAFEGGEEPDVTDYWDRPKPSGWDYP